MPSRKRREVKVAVQLPETAVAELEVLAKQMDAAGFCKAFQGVIAMGVGGMVGHLGRDGAANFFDRWVAAQATIQGQIDPGAGGELVIPGAGPE